MKAWTCDCSKTKFYKKWGKNELCLSYEREESNECYWRIYCTPCSTVTIVKFEQVNAEWERAVEKWFL